MRFLLLIVLLLRVTATFSQNIIKGMVYDRDSVTWLNASLVLLHNDSIVAQCVNSECGFLLKNISNGTYILNISHVGYRDSLKVLDVRDNVDLGNIYLSSGYELGEVVVTAARNVTTYKNNILHINVKNTFLQELPSVENVLNNIPGVRVSSDKLTYFGKGQLLLLVNGREVKSMEEVSSLQPSQISEIVVDNMPGAKYDARYSSVLNIKTTLEKPALMVYNTNTLGRHYSSTAGFTSQSKIRNTLIDFGYGFRKRKNTLYSEQTEENFQPDNQFERSFTDTTYSCRQSHDWHIGTQSKINAGTLGVIYSGYYSSNKPEHSSFMQNKSAAGNESLTILSAGKYAEQQHLVTLDYMLEFNPHNTFRVTADYLNQKTEDDTHASESFEHTNKYTILNFHGKYDIYSVLSEYEHSFSDVFKLSAGARYSYVHNANDSKENDVPTFYNLGEHRYALYAEAGFQWKRMNLSFGLRGERFNKRYDCSAQDATSHNDLFILPSFSFSYQCSEGLQLSFSGNNKVTLPSFNELTPIITYLNQNSYMVGNPLLKPTLRYDLGIGVTWRNKFNVRAEYNLMKDDRIAFSTPDEYNAQALKYTYTNIDKSEQFTGMLTYSDNLFARHVFSLSTGILVPNVKIPYREEELHRTKPSYFVQFYSNWKLNQITNFSINYAFQSKSYDKADTNSATHDLGCNLSVVPIKNKLSISLQVNDILKKATGDWETKYGYIRTGQINNADSRSVVLSLRYTFNSLKSTMRGNSNSEEMERL